MSVVEEVERGARADRVEAGPSNPAGSNRGRVILGRTTR